MQESHTADFKFELGMPTNCCIGSSFSLSHKWKLELSVMQQILDRGALILKGGTFRQNTNVMYVHGAEKDSQIVKMTESWFTDSVNSCMQVNALSDRQIP